MIPLWTRWVRARRRRLGLRIWSTPAPPSHNVQLGDESELRRHPPLLPDDALQEFDQTSDVERAWVGRHLASGEGDVTVVELGPFLGAMSLAIGAALEDRPVARHAFHVYDQFHFEHQDHIFAGVQNFDYVEGASFRPLYDLRIRSIAHRVEVHEGTIETAEWLHGQPINFLFNDVSKSWSAWKAVRRTFFGSLVPGSIVVEQDFGHRCTPWLHLSYHRWIDRVDAIGSIPGTTSMVFQVRHRIPLEELERDDQVLGFTPAEVQATFDWAESVVDPMHRGEVRAARIMLYVLSGDMGVATDELVKAIAEGQLDDDQVADLALAVGAGLAVVTTKEGMYETLSPRTRRSARDLDRLLVDAARDGWLGLDQRVRLKDLAVRDAAWKARRTDLRPGPSTLETKQIESRRQPALEQGRNWRAF